MKTFEDKENGITGLSAKPNDLLGSISFAQLNEHLEEMRQKISPILIGETGTGKAKGFYVSKTSGAVIVQKPKETYLTDQLTIRRELRMLNPIEIIVTPYLPIGIGGQAKRHKRKSSRRWQKKWLKKFGLNPVKEILQIGNKMFVSPQTNQRILEHLSKSLTKIEQGIWGNENLY